MATCVGSRKCSLPTSLTADRTQVYVYTEDVDGHSMSMMSLRQTGFLVRFVVPITGSTVIALLKVCMVKIKCKN